MNEKQHESLGDYFDRVDRTWRGVCPADFSAGGWPMWAYPAVQESVGARERPCAPCAYGPTPYERTGELLPNTTMMPRARDTRNGRPMHDDPHDLGGASVSVGSARCVYLSIIEPVVPDDDVCDDDVCDDDALDTRPESAAQLAAPEPISPYTPEQRAFAGRLLDAFDIGKKRDRHRELGRILRDIAATGDWVFWIKTLLYVMRNHSGFAVWRRERDEGIHRRGRKPKLIAETGQ